MRYRVRESPGELGQPMGEGMVFFTAILGLFIGAILLVGGIRGRQVWLAVWGGGLVLASLAYIGYCAMNYFIYIK